MAHAIKAMSHDITHRRRPGTALFGRVRKTLRLWRTRRGERAQLARFTEHELRDIGLTCVDRANLVGKPLWRG